jgi:DNA topoisomerase-1
LLPSSIVQALPKAWRRVKSAQQASARMSRRIRTLVRKISVKGPPDPVESAKLAGLRYVNDERTPGISRIGRQNRFRYVGPDGRTIGDRTELQRIRALAIPPAWKDVWICPNPLGHLQATGRDARGRKQYRYHPRWREVRDEVKYGRLVKFAEALPQIRARTNADLQRPGLPCEKVLAAVVQLLEKTLIRVGNEEYARQNRSFGLTTMRDEHAKVAGSKVRFEFRGKSGIEHAVDLEDRRLARIVKACRDLPGYELFQYIGDDGKRHVVDSADVNDYLRSISGEDFTAKDFRTWAGTVLAAKALAATQAFTSNREAKRNIVTAIESVAKRLGNTRTVCRKCYIHPAVFDAYLDGATIQTVRARAARLAAKSSRLSAEETAVVRLLEKRLRARKGRESVSAPAA